MAEEWLTYSALGERLGVSPEAARQKAMRLRLRRRPGNDGKAQVFVDVEDVKASSSPRRPKEQADDQPTPDAPPSDTRTVEAMEAHVQTLQSMIAKLEETLQAERGRTESERARADVERARADDERARADAERGRVGDFQTRIEEMLADRAQRAENTQKVESEIQKLNALVAELRRPWWKRRRA